MMKIDAQPLPRKGFLRWLGRDEGEEAASGCDACPQPHADCGEDPRIRRRRQLMADITSFLMAHRLDISPATLAFAYDLISGSDPALADKVSERIEARRPVTHEWLEHVAPRSQPADASQAQHHLIEQVETTIHEFAQTAGSARDATTEYNCALELHADGLRQGQPPAAGQVHQILHDMLARTRKLESQLDRSERATRKLQKRLQAARREAERDHLTGLPNRRAFEAVFAREAAFASSHNEPLCVAFCDIDNFKRINDVHGHEAGDRVLRSVARSLAAISDDTCHVARHGGEEFVAVLRGRTLDQAHATLDAAREALAQRRLVNRTSDQPFGQITFSAGVADVHAYPQPRAALRAADTALYEAKRHGRNLVVRADPNWPPGKRRGRHEPADPKASPSPD
jgi:diguanylate cyclase